MNDISIHRRICYVLQGILFLELLLALWRQNWLPAFSAAGIIGITFIPYIVERRFRVHIPPQLQLMGIAFAFAALFLGEMRGYYTRFWWWDIVLHTSSGFLLGIVGFLLVHVLNEIEKIGMQLKPGFVAFFAFLFAVGLGALWEIFEFSMDTFFGTNMQKPMLHDPSGLLDTMVDLIVDTIGALVISLIGYYNLKVVCNTSFLERWIEAFIERNPHLFSRRK
ncbi:MAG: hypothetical protein NVV73_00740 [Cellvibrionaceae bacterium]|nr:hypothetical protein [Cellvibrionaceae bacterium]